MNYLLVISSRTHASLALCASPRLSEGRPKASVRPSAPGLRVTGGHAWREDGGRDRARHSYRQEERTRERERETWRSNSWLSRVNPSCGSVPATCMTNGSSSVGAREYQPERSALKRKKERTLYCTHRFTEERV